MHVLRLLKFPAQSVIDTLFPPTCWANPDAPTAEAGLSPAARLQIAQLAAQNYCRRCGLTTGPHTHHDFANPCHRCHMPGQRNGGVRRTARVGTFSEPLVTLVHRLKFARSWEIGRILAPFLYHAITQVSEQTQTPVDLLIPVPLHWTRRARRGFNQAEELARQTAALADWKIRTPLRRIRATHEQTKIHAATTRIDNLQGAFVCRPDKQLAGKHLWLIDDVSTTGATLHAAATAIRKLPKECRPASLSAAVICITDHESPPPPA